MSEAAPRQVFFSYGRQEGAAFVERLRAALTALSYACWKDDHEIKDDEAWRLSIYRGLRGTERTIAFLTAHALRPHGPCGDELRIVRNINGGPITPILLEKVTIPYWIDHRNAIDLSDWAVQEDDPVWFDATVARLRAVLDDPASRRQAAELARLRTLLAPATQAYRLPALLEGFVGRRWLRDRIEHWRRNEAQHRMVCVIGGPGAGKSAFMAWLAQEHRGTVVALNLCTVGSGESTQPAAVIRTLAFLIACELEDYRVALLARLEGSARLRQLVERENAVDLFGQLLNEPLHYLVNGRGGERLLILIDSLDESIVAYGSPLLDVLRTEGRHLPPWVALVLSTRPEPLLLPDLDDVPQHIIDEDAENDADLVVYARGALPGQADAAVARAVMAAHGKMFALKMLLQGLREGKFNLADATLPHGLDAILRNWIRRQFPDTATYQAEIRPVLDVLAAAGRPVPLAVLDAVRGWSPRQRAGVLERLGSLVVIRAGALAPWHPALLEFLGRDAAGSRYMLDEGDGAAALWQVLWRAEVLRAPDAFAATVLPVLAQRPDLPDSEPARG